MTEEGLRLDYLPGCGYKIFQSSAEFPFTTDSVLLARFAHLVHGAKVLELGCGTAAVSLLLLARGAAHVTGLDINPRVLDLARRSAELNELTEQTLFIEGDAAAYRELLPPESFDLAVANPPYRKAGRQRQIGAAACHEVRGNLADFIAAAAWAVRFRGRFALCQLPERLLETLELLREQGLMPKRLRFLHSDVKKPAWLFLLEAVKGGSMGLEVLPPLVLYEEGARQKN